MAKAASEEDLDQTPGYLYATCGDVIMEPNVWLELHHGAGPELEPEYVAAQGLPSRGTDIDLVRHAQQPAGYDPETSAFRGTVQFPAYPGFTVGAVHWAGEGGLVFEIRQWKGYELSKLDGHVRTLTGAFGGTTMQEQEIAIPARVPKRWLLVQPRFTQSRPCSLCPCCCPTRPWRTPAV